jgi:hypothetical protein
MLVIVPLRGQTVTVVLHASLVVVQVSIRELPVAPWAIGAWHVVMLIVVPLRQTVIVVLHVLL